MTSRGTAVFVHGNPETSAVWDLLLAELERDDVVRLSPPGFGAPLPTRFGATMEDYRDWLVERLEAFKEPVDLVGHDWGGAHVVNVAMARPDLLRSWVSDAAGLFEPGYVWHPLAQTWQTPAGGEQQIASMIDVPLANRIKAMRALGIASPVAERLAAGQDDQMGRAILALYRSARQPAMTAVGRGLARAAERPGLVVVASEDQMTGTTEMRLHAARRAGASVAVLPELGHWWMVQDPRQAAQVLTTFWSHLP